MKNNVIIEQEIQKTLALLRDREHIDPDPSFATRLQSRRQNEEVRWQHGQFSILRMHYLKPALLFLFLMAHIVTATLVLGNDTSKSVARSESMNEFADEFSLGNGEYSLLTFGE
jgi:hypothetical protein